MPLAQVGEDPERRVAFGGLTFKDYVILSDVIGHRPSVRLTYLEGQLEIMTTSTTHELLKKVLARLVELYALVRGVRITGAGNATFRREDAERGLEPDECYYVDRVKEFPDLALEVVLSRPLVDKLEVYRGLGVREVWVLEAGKVTVHRLEGGRYAPVSRSGFFPELDPELLSEHIGMEDQDAAVRAFWEKLGRPSG